MLLLWWLFLLGICGLISFFIGSRQAGFLVQISKFILILAFGILALSAGSYHSISPDSIRRVIFLTPR
jgi:hypothetical protein